MASFYRTQLRFFALGAVFLSFSLSGSFSANAAQKKIDASSSDFSSKFNHELTLQIRNTPHTVSKKELSLWFEETSALDFNPRYQSEIENINYCQFKKSLPCELLWSHRKNVHLQKVVSFSPKEEVIAEYLRDLARQINKDPENAKLKMENGRVSTFEIEKNGLRLDEEQSLKNILDYLNQEDDDSTIGLAYTEISPEISIDSIDTMGVNDLIGVGRSNFRGSPKNRIHNIKVATSRFDGLLIKPGEEFSFVKNLGEVDGEHGYLPELVIKKNKTEPEFGGGICQVSTTAFRAAIYSGLEVTARRNHAYPVQYYAPHGMDSTVYIPRPDLRFMNNTPGYILIQTRFEGTELIFEFYGKNDGRKVTVTGPTITEKNPDGSMKTTFTQEVYDKDDNLMKKDVFNSSYDSPSKYPHPATTNEILKSKPKDWSKKEWETYKKANGI